jgi:hypothetical protein
VTETTREEPTTQYHHDDAMRLCDIALAALDADDEAKALEALSYALVQEARAVQRCVELGTSRASHCILLDSAASIAVRMRELAQRLPPVGRHLAGTGLISLASEPSDVR